MATSSTLKGEKRSTTDVLLNAPVVIELCGKKYEIREKNIADSLEWRTKCGELMQSLVGIFKENLEGQETVSNTELIQKAMPILLGVGLDKIIDMLFSYTKELAADREKILAEASASEVVDAAMEVFNLSFPFVRAVVSGMLKMMTRAGLANLTPKTAK